MSLSWEFYLVTLLLFNVLREGSRKRISKLEMSSFSINVIEVLKLLLPYFECKTSANIRFSGQQSNILKRNWWSSITTFRSIMRRKAEWSTHIKLLKIDRNLLCVGVSLNYLRLFISHPIVIFFIHSDNHIWWCELSMDESKFKKISNSEVGK